MPSCQDMSSCHEITSCHDISSWNGMSSCHDMSSCHGMSTCHAMSQSQKLFCLNLDALAVPEALVNSFRILAIFSIRLNPPQHQNRPKQKSAPDLPRDPHHRVRGVPCSTGDTARAPGTAKMTIFEKCCSLKKIHIFGLAECAQRFNKILGPAGDLIGGHGAHGTSKKSPAHEQYSSIKFYT